MQIANSSLIEARDGAIQACNKGDNDTAIRLYTEVIATELATSSDYWGRGSSRFHINDYDKCIADCQKAIELGLVNQSCYVTLAKSHITRGSLEDAKGIMGRAVLLFPDSQKLQTLMSDIGQKQTVSNQEEYMQRIFTKICQDPKVSTYLKDESFITKLQMMIRNPSMMNSLCKLDPRISQAYDILLLTDQ